jgi:2-haloacid dehalogenase
MTTERDRVLVFDVNETLLDLSALDPHFARVFGDAAVRREWFATMLQSALLLTVTGPYFDFGSHFRAALAHPEVRESLTRLRNAGFRVAALTNSTGQVEEAQLANAGIRDLFDQALSADDAKRLKPAPEAYAAAARKLGVPLNRVRLVAAHAWDVAGAMRAGASGAFVARPGALWNPLLEKPDVWGKDLREVADQIIARDR